MNNLDEFKALMNTWLKLLREATGAPLPQTSDNLLPAATSRENTDEFDPGPITVERRRRSL